MLCPYCLNDVTFAPVGAGVPSISDEETPSAATSPAPDPKSTRSTPPKRDRGGSPEPPRAAHYRCPVPTCRQFIPPMYFKDYDTYPPVIVNVVGFKGHGKSVYLSSLFHTLRRPELVQAWPGFYTLALDDDSLERVYRNMRQLEEGRLPPPTEKSLLRPTLLRFLNVPGLDPGTLVAYDVSGEHFRHGAAIGEFARFVTHATTVLFLVSIAGLLVEAGDYAQAMERLLQTYLIGMSQLGGDTRAQNLVVAYTKADELVRSLDGWPALQAHAQAGLFDGLADIPAYLETTRAMSGELYHFTEHGLGAGMFLSAARDNFNTLNFCLLSSLGAKPDEASQTLAIKVSPRRVLDPLLLLLAGHSAALSPSRGPWYARLQQAWGA